VKFYLKKDIEIFITNQAAKKKNCMSLINGLGLSHGLLEGDWIN
jgi:hypothetical protein